MSLDKTNTKSFFSVSFELISVGKPLDYNLFINSSAHATRARFIKVFPKGEVLEASDMKGFKQKYHQLYIQEDERAVYLKSLTSNENYSDNEKVSVIKDSAIHYLSNLFDDSHEFTTDVLTESIKGCRESVVSMVDVIRDYDVDDIQSMIGELSFHDFYTFDHSINVSMYNISITKILNPSATNGELITAGLGGLLHDLGKIKIPTNIINNPGKLSNEEFEIIKKHPLLGSELFDPSLYKMSDVDFEAVRRVILEHHENYNGTGYPNKIEGESIHELARITSIADFFDAITTKRSYHEVLSTPEALNVMEKTIGRKIDPIIFAVFSRSIADFDLSKKVENERSLPDNFDPCHPQNILPFNNGHNHSHHRDDQHEEVKIKEIKKKAS